MNLHERIILISSLFVVSGFGIIFGDTTSIKLLTPRFDATMENPDTVSNPVTISWKTADSLNNKYMLVKVYNYPNNRQVYPRRDKRNIKSFSGVKISLVPGLYKIDISSLDSDDYTNTWIYVKGGN